MEIPPEPTSVAGDAVVAVMATQHRRQMLVLLSDRLMPVTLTPLADRRQGAGKPALCRHLPHHVLAVPGFSPHVGKAQEVERSPARRRVAQAIRTPKAEVDEPRLVRMEGKSKPGQPLSQHLEDPLGVEVVLE